MWKRSFREWLKLTLQHSTQRCVARLFRKRVRGLWSAEAKLPPDAEGGRTAVRPSPTLWELKGVGFLLVCLPVKLPSKVFLLPCERDARAPSTRCAENAGVSPAIPTAQEKNLPL
jgi:hypothetical protein